MVKTAVQVMMRQNLKALRIEIREMILIDEADTQNLGASQVECRT